MEYLRKYTYRYNSSYLWGGKLGVNSLGPYVLFPFQVTNHVTILSFQAIN